MLNETGALDVAIDTDARLVIANRVVKRVAICKELEFVPRTVNETKAMFQRNGPQTDEELHGQVATK